MKTKDNKLIAEFMEIELFGKQQNHTEALLICSALDLFVNPCTHFDNVLDTIYLDDMKFHKSWDWLMPVVEKIEGLEFRCMIAEDEADIESKYDNPIQKAFGTYCPDGTKIGATYKAVVEFIKWYNRQ